MGHDWEINKDMIDCVNKVFQLPGVKLDRCGKEGRDLRSRTIEISLISLMGGGNTEQIWEHCFFFAKQVANVPKACNSKPRLWQSNIYWESKKKTAENHIEKVL